MPKCAHLVAVAVCRDKAPGQRECDEAIETLNRCVRDVDQASLAAISQQLAPREGISQEVRRGSAGAGGAARWASGESLTTSSPSWRACGRQRSCLSPAVQKRRWEGGRPAGWPLLARGRDCRPSSIRIGSCSSSWGGGNCPPAAPNWCSGLTPSAGPA